MILHHVLLATLAVSTPFVLGGSVSHVGNSCTVHPAGNKTDDSAAIVHAFKLCGHGGRVKFLNETYWIEKVMNTTGLRDVEVDLSGTLLWSADNISYWLENSLPTGYQNQTSAWFFGGHNIKFQGHGYGTFDGNGQIWYDYTKGVSNLAGRPHALTIWETTNSKFEGIRFVQSQMWTMTVAYSRHVELSDIYVSSTTNDSYPARNTDGADTLGSSFITFRRWEVHNGDDSIAMKRNSSDILVEDSVFYDGLGVAIGSIGQYNGEYEFVERVTMRNCTFIGTRYVGYIKTWTGVQQGYPPNGGGGGTGYARDILWTNSTLQGVYSYPAEITQCTSFSGAVKYCNSSTLAISNVEWSNLSGTITGGTVATLQCSGAAPCENVIIQNNNIVLGGNATIPGYKCTDVGSTVGFACN